MVHWVSTGLAYHLYDVSNRGTQILATAGEAGCIYLLRKHDRGFMADGLNMKIRDFPY